NSTPVMVMTAWSSFDIAVEAMRRGACDFIQKPWDNDRLIAAIRKQAESERRKRSELEIAANVQQKLFPRNLRPMRTVDYAGGCPGARGRGRLLRLPRDHRSLARFRPGRRLGQGCPGRAADGE